MRKMKKETEAANVLVGELEGLDQPLCCFIRLNEAVFLGDLTEVPLATKFIFIYVGPPVGYLYMTRYETLSTLSWNWLISRMRILMRIPITRLAAACPPSCLMRSFRSSHTGPGTGVTSLLESRYYLLVQVALYCT